MFNVSDSLEFLKLGGLPVINTVKVNSVNGLELACERLGYPLVMKLDTPEHKTDIGGVVVGINSLDEALRVYKRLLKTSKEIVVQKQAKGIELSLGVKKDPVFGQVVMFGLGGVFIELYKDVVFRVCPISKAEAKDMINELKSIKLLKGFRGAEKVNIELLAELVKSLSVMAVKSDIKELDINPIFASGNDLIIVDARLEI